MAGDLIIFDMKGSLTFSWTFFLKLFMRLFILYSIACVIST